MDATFDEGKIEKIRKRSNPTIEFVGLNDFKIETQSFDTLTLEKKLADILKHRRHTNELTILDSKNRIYKEHVLIVRQLHRILLRVKDTISKERLGIEYKEIRNQQDINSIDKIIPLEIMIVDKMHWR